MFSICACHAMKGTLPKAVIRSREKVRALSKADRLKARPNGCSRCRWKPGCTPCCFDNQAGRM